MLRSIVLGTLLLVPALVVSQARAQAQAPQGIDPAALMRQFQDPAAMERMAREAEAAQKCFEKISKSEIEALERKGKRAAAEIDSLCAAGKRDEALERAIALSREMQNDPTVLQLRKCADDMKETQLMLQSMPWTQMPGVDEDDEPPTKDEVCS